MMRSDDEKMMVFFLAALFRAAHLARPRTGTEDPLESADAFDEAKDFMGTAKLKGVWPIKQEVGR